jgi:hypothetical protein
MNLLLHLILSAGWRKGLRKMREKNEEAPQDPKLMKKGSKKGKKAALEPSDAVAETAVTFDIKQYDTSSKENQPKKHSIGEVSETSLHAGIKQVLAKPGDQFEVKIEGKIVDIFRRSGEIVEVQTGNFGKLKSKIEHLSSKYPIRVVYPIPVKKIIVQLDAKTGVELSRRKSPKKNNIYTLFDELVYFPTLLSLPGVSLEVLFVEIEELRVRDGRGSWRRKFQSILDKRLSRNEKNHLFTSNADLLRLLPDTLPPEFTVSMLAHEADINVHIAREMAYVLKKAGLISEEGKKGREKLYRRGKIIRTTKPKIVQSTDSPRGGPKARSS